MAQEAIYCTVYNRDGLIRFPGECRASVRRLQSMTMFEFGGFGGKTDYGVALMINLDLLEQVLDQSHEAGKD
jgi:hypothetical protein